MPSLLRQYDKKRAKKARDFNDTCEEIGYDRKSPVNKGQKNDRSISVKNNRLIIGENGLKLVYVSVPNIVFFLT